MLHYLQGRCSSFKHPLEILLYAQCHYLSVAVELYTYIIIMFYGPVKLAK